MKKSVRIISKFIFFIYIISLVCYSTINVKASSANLISNPYPITSQQKSQYMDGKIITPILPYGDYFSLFTKLPLGHTKSTDKGINIGVIGDNQYANFIYFVARDSKVYNFNTLSIDDLKNQDINVVTIKDFRNYNSNDLKKFVEACNSYNIPLLIDGDLATTSEEIKLVKIRRASSRERLWISRVAVSAT